LTQSAVDQKIPLSYSPTYVRFNCAVGSLCFFAWVPRCVFHETFWPTALLHVALFPPSASTLAVCPPPVTLSQEFFTTGGGSAGRQRRSFRFCVTKRFLHSRPAPGRAGPALLQTPPPSFCFFTARFLGITSLPSVGLSLSISPPFLSPVGVSQLGPGLFPSE